MTALAGRRRRATQMAVAGTVLALIGAAALTVVGVNTLADSKAGRRGDRERQRPVQRLPYTPTALVGTVDDEGRLASMAVVVAKPAGGGSVIPVPVSADASGGEAEFRLPVAETFELEPETLEPRSRSCSAWSSTRSPCSTPISSPPAWRRSASWTSIFRST